MNATATGYLQEWSRLLELERENLRLRPAACLVFRLGTHWLALHADSCLEVMSESPIRRLPLRSDATLLGLVSIRGEILLCFSLTEPLGLKPLKVESEALSRHPRRLVVAGNTRFKFAFPADEILGMERFSLEMLEPLPADGQAVIPRFSRNMLTLDGRKVCVLEDQQVFAALEQSLV